MIKYVGIIAHYLHDENDSLLFTVPLNKYNHIALNQNKENKIIGKGRVFWEPNWCQFTMTEYDDYHVKLHWKDKEFAKHKSTLDILHRPLTVGKYIAYLDRGERYIYVINDIVGNKEI